MSLTWEGTSFAQIMLNPEKEVSLLEILKQQPDSGQRDLAEAVGMSLGMTNLILKDLSQKGWVMIRKINARNFQYLLTPEGLKELSKRSYRFLKKTIRNVADCREKLEKLVDHVKSRGFAGIVLCGNSDLEFVLEFLCHKKSLGFQHDPQRNLETPSGWFVVHSENEPTSNPNVLEWFEAPTVSSTPRRREES